MSVFRSTASSTSTTGFTERAEAVHEEKRQTTRSGVLAQGTLACRHCDAPVALGPDRRSLIDQVMCPYCLRQGPLREFLSLLAPTRPARVVVRVRI